MIRKITTALALTTMILTSATAASAEARGQLFEDLDTTHKIAPYVADLVEQGIIKGFPDGTFRPNLNITRNQTAVMIARAIGVDTKKQFVGHMPFLDTNYLPNENKVAIQHLINIGVIRKEDIGKRFYPGQEITRGELVEWTTLAFGLYVPESALNGLGFVDIRDLEELEAANTLKYYGIVTGYEGKQGAEFRPEAPARRSHFSQIISQAMEVRDSLENSGAVY